MELTFSLQPSGLETFIPLIKADFHRILVTRALRKRSDNVTLAKRAQDLTQPYLVQFPAERGIAIRRSV